MYRVAWTIHDIICKVTNKVMCLLILPFYFVMTRSKMNPVVECDGITKIMVCAILYVEWYI